MADGPTPAHWADLRARMPVAEDALATIPVTPEGAETPLSIAMDVAGNLHLLAPVQRDPVVPMPPDLKGLKVRHRILETQEVADLRHAFVVESRRQAWSALTEIDRLLAPYNQT